MADGWPESTVKSWNGLQSALHSRAMVPPRPNQGGHLRSGYMFRGMADAGWGLLTSLERHWPEGENVERPALRAFGKYASAGSFAASSEWERLSIAQHNGLPTRCLDWTASPLIAAHFATVEREHFKKDGVIWCVQAETVREHLLSAKMMETLGREKAFVFDISMLKSYWPTLDVFDNTEGDHLLFFEPPSIDNRIHNQFGLLSVMNGPTKSHERYLKKGLAKHRGLVRRIIITSDAKPEIRDKLDQNNITERMLFPGLPGLCDWLRRYYGPA